MRLPFAAGVVALACIGFGMACSGNHNGSSGSSAPNSEAGARSSKDARAADAMSANDPDHAAMTMTHPAGTANVASGSHELALSPDMIQRAGIKTVAAMKGNAAMSLHLPGIVQPNAYKNVDVTSLVSGRVLQVRAELGQTVMLNEVLATVYSPELTDAQTTFISAKAQRDAHGLALTRTQRLYAIGAASREELEKMTAEASEMDRAVETARARLTLLGIPEERAQRLASPTDVVTSFEVKAPFAGIITKRNANVGLNVDLSTPLFTVTDLSTVWVVADLYERDFASAGVGSPVTITTMAYPGMQLKGRVQYIDPQVEAETRTAKLRAEVPNAGGRLRFGMYVDVNISARATRPVVMVPKAAVQTVGTQSVVYVATAPNRFVQRAVTLGDSMGNDIAISSGLDAGDEVVTEGAFFLRAESERLP